MRLFHLPFASAALIPAFASAGAARDDGLQRCLTAAVARADLSGSIMVSQGDRIWASIERGRMAGPCSPPITRATRFNLAFASKMFTAVAIGQLIDAGKLRLDQPIGEAVRGLTPEAARVSVRQLLTHSSGLGDIFRPDNMGAMLKARTASDILPLTASEKPAFPPGSRFAYSNSGFALLGIAIERVAGVTYGEYLRQHIFVPDGMASTGPDPKPLAALAVGMTAFNPTVSGPPDPSRPARVGRLANGQAHPPGQSVAGVVLIGPPEHSSSGSQARAQGPLHPAPGAVEGYGSPAGGLFGTAGDMRRFAVALLSNKLLSPATTAAFTSAQIESAPATAERPARRYGFGFGVSDEAGNTGSVTAAARSEPIPSSWSAARVSG